MDISLMTALKPPVAGSSEEKLAAPDKSAFEDELQEAMAPPGAEAPPPPDGVEGAMRTEAETQPNADDKSLDQPQDEAQTQAVNAVILWQPLQGITTQIDAASGVAPTVQPVAANAPVADEGVTSDDAEESPLRTPTPSDAHESAEAVLQTKTALPNPVSSINIAEAELAAHLDSSEVEETDSEEDAKIESVDVEQTRTNEAPRPAQEQIQIKPHALDRASKALEAVHEARQPIQSESNIRSTTVKMTMASEVFGNLSISVKSLGTDLEADVETQHQDLNRALNVHRPDLIQSIESKGLTLSQFDVRQEGGEQGQPNPHDQPATKEDLERMARLNFAPAEDKPVTRPVVGLVNTLA